MRIFFKQIRSLPLAGLLALAVMFPLGATNSFAADDVVSQPFSGAAVESGTVTYSNHGKDRVLTLSDDFRIHEEPPDPHWQVVDSKGNVYLLQKLKIKDNQTNKSITLPAYIEDVAKVQMWCAFADILLGEASFAQPIALK